MAEYPLNIEQVESVRSVGRHALVKNAGAGSAQIVGSHVAESGL